MPKETRKLPVRLSEAELKAKADDLAKANIDRVNLENEKSKLSSEFNARIKEIKGDIAELSQAISSRMEHRDVEIEERRNEQSFMIETFRLDTDEKISERAMTTSERQVPLFPVQGGKQEEPTTRRRRSSQSSEESA